MSQSYEKACNISHYKCFNFIVINFQNDTLNTYKNFHIRMADSNPDATYIGFGIFHYHAIASRIFEQFLCFHFYSHCLLFHRPSPFFHVLASISCKSDSPSDDFLVSLEQSREEKAMPSYLYWIVLIQGSQILPLTWVHSSSCEPRRLGFMWRYSALNAVASFALYKEIHIFTSTERGRR